MVPRTQAAGKSQTNTFRIYDRSDTFENLVYLNRISKVSYVLHRITNIKPAMAKPEKRKQRPQGQVVTDPRFAKLHTDARFQIFPNKQRKVEIDERFKGRQ